MLSIVDEEILYSVHQRVPKFKAFLERRLQEELSDLPHKSVDKVQLHQGRCLALRDLLADLDAVGTMAHRTTKPNFSTP